MQTTVGDSDEVHRASRDHPDGASSTVGMGQTGQLLSEGGGLLGADPPDHLVGALVAFEVGQHGLSLANPAKSMQYDWPPLAELTA